VISGGVYGGNFSDEKKAFASREECKPGGISPDCKAVLWGCEKIKLLREMPSRLFL